MSICDSCVNFVLDEELQEYFCDAPLDQDEVGRLFKGNDKSCPYFRLDDEYSVVRKQN